MASSARRNAASAVWRALLAPALTLVLAHPACAAEAAGRSPPAGAPTVLHLTQSAERRLPRDLLHVEMRAEQTGGNPQAVEAAINRGMAKALAEAQRVRGIEISTGSDAVYRVTPPKSAAEWSGAQSLSLTGRDAGVLLQLAGRLESEGLVMANLMYEISPETMHGAEDALTAEALSALQRRAVAIAQQLHLAVVGYRDVTIGNAESGEGPRPLFAAAARAAMPAPVGAPGEATVTVTVDADIVLAPK
jgi:predicted secreted protein